MIFFGFDHGRPEWSRIGVALIELCSSRHLVIFI